MRASIAHLLFSLGAASLLSATACSSDEPDGPEPKWEPTDVQAHPIGGEATGHPGFASPQVQSLALSAERHELYVTNTAADTLDVIDTETRTFVRRIAVGIDPASVALRPDERELWVSNHVSDSVSVIDVDPDSETRFQVVATIQAWEEGGLVTDFDEPLGIAFASNDKAYVALTSRNRIAVVDVKQRRVTKQLQVLAQEPRALTVRDGRLYVVPFESGNQTELSGCVGSLEAPGNVGCTFDLSEVLSANSQDSIITRNFPANIIRNAAVPDRDLFIYDTTDESLIQEVSTLGTLLYGVAVDSKGTVFISQTEARNAENGDAAGGADLVDLENRAFFNRITRVDCNGECGEADLIELEPDLPEQPAAGKALATPFGIQVSDDDATLVAVAAGSNALFTMDAASGEVLGRATVGAVPRSVLLESKEDGSPARAWVFNGVEDSVSLVDVSDVAAPAEIDKIELQDPTDAVVKRGHMAFNDANASTSGTYSCESCHPDGNTDQILWNLGAECVTPGCDQKIPRTTMPIRGLRDTLPLHWDGVVGDPFGGVNGELADSGTVVDPTCEGELDCFRDLVDGSLLGTMCNFNECPDNGEGLPGALSVADRDAMATFLMSVPYPPTRMRQLDDRLSDLAMEGFGVFFVGDSRTTPGCSRNGRCHTPPHWTGTNTPGSGLEAPTFRGLNDRYLLLPNGRANLWDAMSVIGINDVDWDPNHGPDELYSWGMTFGSEAIPLANRFATGGRGPFEIWQFFEETSTGFSGAFGRQVTFNTETDAGAVQFLVDQLEAADQRGVVQLRGTGASLPSGRPVDVTFDDGEYEVLGADGGETERLSRAQLLERAREGSVVLTLTAHMGAAAQFHDEGQPSLWLPGSAAFDGTPVSPNFGLNHVYDTDETLELALFGRHVPKGSRVLLDGQLTEGSVRCYGAGELPSCEDEAIVIELSEKPTSGRHTYQVVGPEGFTSNELMLKSGVPLYQ